MASGLLQYVLVASGALLLAAAPGSTVAQSSAPEPGVSLALAKARRAAIRDVRYDLALTIPEQRTAPVSGTVSIRFRLARPGPVVLDFRAPASHLGLVRANRQVVENARTVDHLTIPAGATAAGDNEISIAFTATDLALNRAADFFYTLFVPDRASTAFPCFDQPDLKGRLRLTLTIPSGWRAVANGSVESEVEQGVTRTIRFTETAPISSYLFAFAAGKLQVVTAVRDGRQFRLYHRETDSAKVSRNVTAIFDLHAASLRWLADYTGIPYPFEKFDFFLVPSFQFGGMEHPGAVWYNPASLFLEQAATRNQLLGRAFVIAHETAHMWFGDLVTMRWFNDVWMKEVFASFMAAKIAEPEFPDINHPLRFYLANHPTAYQVDRTAGANPIRQSLENLADAGQMYGAIIYQKAPVVMRQLEQAIGQDAMRTGLREYLDRYRFDNADWLDLVAILDRQSPEDVRAWSRVWVEEPGRPTIRLSRSLGDDSVAISQRDPSGGDRRWPQRLALTTIGTNSPTTQPVDLTGPMVRLPLPVGTGVILAGTDGIGYGRFVLDLETRSRLVRAIPSIDNGVARAAAWQTAYEEMLGGGIAPDSLVIGAIQALGHERDPLIEQQLLGIVETTFWRFLTASRRETLAPAIEAALWSGLAAAKTPGQKASYFNALVDLSLSGSGVARLEGVWRQVESIAGLPLEERHYTALAEALAVRRVTGFETILDAQERRITNPDRQTRFRFVRQALAADSIKRDSVFNSWKLLENRRREPWVLEAMGYLNHPLVAERSVHYLEPALEMVQEIKRTGDIFFPTGWLLAAMRGHQSARAAGIVARYLLRKRLPVRLQGKALQAADDLFRAAYLIEGWVPPHRLMGEKLEPALRARK